MDKIIIKAPGAPEREFELAQGVNKVGRSINTDLQIDHPSVSSSHCEIIVNDGAIAVKDLGSTNGTFLDGQPVQESQITPGQVLRLGEVEILLVRAPGSKTGLATAVPAATRIPTPAPVAPYEARLVQPPPPRRPKSFYKSIPGAFVYPFKRNGLLLLASGTLIFGVFDFFIGYRVRGMLMLGGIIGGIAAAFVTGYLFYTCRRSSRPRLLAMIRCRHGRSMKAGGTVQRSRISACWPSCWHVWRRRIFVYGLPVMRAGRYSFRC
jgi:hypothetical protein